ncbi:MAG: hypothetical protein QM537_00680 [Candidatus Symbiobacter sp.]|nr:hypothetical protein [Candidatus Symbiobacter sp.]
MRINLTRRMMLVTGRGIRSGFPCLFVVIGLCLVFVAASYAPPTYAGADFLGTPETRAKNVPGNYHKCQNKEVANFVGQNKAKVLAQVKTMNFRTLRVLDGTAPVNYEFVPDRLTLVISQNGVVTRSFCR